MHFLCIKWGDKYSAEYVNKLYGMIDANYVNQFKLVCFTDEPEDIRDEVMIVPIPNVEPLHPKYWFGKENYCWDRAKFLLFNASEWLQTEGPFCYFDLDIIIQNSIDEFYELAFTPHMLRPYWQPKDQLKMRSFQNIRGTYYNSSCMLWWNDQPKKIYEDVLQNSDVVFKTFYKGSDNYHEWRRPAGANFWNFLPEEYYYSYNYCDTDYNAKLALFNQNVYAGHEGISIEELEDNILLNHWHGKYDMYKELPTRAIIELTNKHNDTGNDFNKIFVGNDELSLNDIKLIFKDYKLEWVTFLFTLSDPRKAWDFHRICEWFKDRGTKVSIPEPCFEEPTEEQKQLVEDNKENKPVTYETLKQFKHAIEYRNIKEEVKTFVDCEARNNSHIYINAAGNVFPCSYIARDLTENKLYPYHPIDYPYNWKYNNATKYKIKDIIYNNDFENMNDALKKDPLSICKVKCGRCV